MRARHTLGALALAAALAGPARADGGRDLETRAGALLAAQRSASADGASHEGDQLALARSLAALGGEAVPTLFDVLVERRYRAEVDGELAPYPLAPWQATAVSAALVTLPRDAVLAFLRERVLGSEERAAQTTALALCSELGGARALRLMLDIADAAQAGGEALDAALQMEFEHAAAALMAREPETVHDLRQMWRGIADHMLAPAVRAVGRSESVEGIELLADQLGWRADLDLLMLVQVGRLALYVPADFDSGEVVDVLRAYLASSEPALRREAAVDLGRLGAEEAVLDLVALLDDDGPRVSEKALEALHRITGMRLPGARERWRAWHAEELRWMREERPAVLAQLESRDLADVVAAIGELSRRRLFRGEIALDLSQTLWVEDPFVRTLGCIALSHLGSSAAVPALVEVLGDSDERVRSAARAALERITGEDLPAEAEAWRERFGGARG